MSLSLGKFGSLGEAYKSIARAQPNAIALSWKGRTWSYSEIDRLSDGIAHALLLRGLCPGKTVSVSAHEVDVQLSYCLGVLKAGATYAAIDPLLPPHRFLSTVKAGNIATCIVGDDHHRIVGALRAQDVPVITPCAPDTQQTDLPDLPINGSAFSHLLFTSGSTGQPKAVWRTHEDILRSCDRHRPLGLSRHDRVTLITRRGFFDSVSNPLVTILNGAVICAGSVLTDDQSTLGEWLADEAPTVYYSFPTIFRALTESRRASKALKNLRLMYLGGEPIRRTDIAACKRLLDPEAQLAIGLGSTEAGLVALKVSRVHDLDPFALPTVGFAVDGIEIEIQENGQPVGRGNVGEIAVRNKRIGGPLQEGNICEIGVPSIYMTGDLGYYNNSNELVVVGRSDQRIKLRGFRIDLGDVESAVAQLAGVSETAVILHRDSEEDSDGTLVAFVTLAESLTSDEIRLELQETLPDHMVPHKVVILKELPKTINGKLDRKALLSMYRPDECGEHAPAPLSVDQYEKRIADQWVLVLGRELRTRADNFFDLGGTSIKALRLISLVRKAVGGPVPLHFLFESPCFGEFCEKCKGFSYAQPIEPLPRGH